MVSVTTVPFVPPSLVTWYFVTPRSSVAGSQVTTAEIPSAVALTAVGAEGARVSGSSAAHGSFAAEVTVRSFTVVSPAVRV